jgi:hypothetical protein
MSITVFFGCVAINSMRGKSKVEEYRTEKSYSGDTLIYKYYKKNTDILLKEEKLVNGEPVGAWNEYDKSGNIILTRDFSKLVYDLEPPEGVVESPKDEEDCENCEKPSFPGGEDQLFKYLGEEISYPEESKEMNSSGVVYMWFIVRKTGEVEPYSIIRGVDTFIDEETWRLVENMPDWEPAIMNAKPIDTYINLPVRFTLK